MARHKNIRVTGSADGDARLNFLGDVFIRLNAQYSLVKAHRFSFEDFLANPNERAIHLYFANKPLFINRRHNAVIALPLFLQNPLEILHAALDVDRAYREAEGVQSERLLASQAITSLWISIANLACFQEISDTRFEKKHRVVIRDNKQVEPIHRCYRHERKQAGGKR